MHTSMDDAQKLGQMMLGAWMTQAIYVAAELGVADVLARGPATANELSSALGTRGDGLDRVMRALCSAGVFKQDDERRYALTSLGRLFRSDVPDSKRAYARMSGAEFYRSWDGLLESVKTGTQAFSLKFGKEFFSYMAENPSRWGVYDEAMHCVHGPETLPMLEAYNFGRFSSVVDVGGGKGLTLAAILQRFPDVKGILQELPDVASRAAQTFENLGLTSRASVSAGNFFESVPGGADAYLLRHVIHDWQDEEALKILNNCRQAMKPGSRVLVVESVIGAGNRPGFVKWLDLMMMIVGGRERTLDEYRKLLESAGLRLSKAIPTSCEVSLLEAEPA